MFGATLTQLDVLALIVSKLKFQHQTIVNVTAWLSSQGIGLGIKGPQVQNHPRFA